nr:unnamed protein product [Callosobruchus chinensis]
MVKIKKVIIKIIVHTFPCNNNDTKIYFLYASSMMCETACAGVVIATSKKYSALSRLRTAR